VEFSLAGQDTGAGKKRRDAPKSAAQPPAVAVEDKAAEPRKAETEPGSVPSAKPETGKARATKRLNPMMVGGAALALVAVTGGWLMFGGGPSNNIDEALLEQGEVAPTTGPATPPITSLEPVEGVAALIAEARRFGAPAAVIARLSSAADTLAKAGPSPGGSAPAAGEQIRAAAAQFATGLQKDAEAKARQLAASVPWASATRANAARAEPGNRQAIARSLRTSLQALRAASARTASAASPEDSLGGAHEALVQWRGLTAGIRAAYRAQSLPAPAGLPSLPGVSEEIAPAPGQAPEAAQGVVPEEPSAATAGVSSGKRSQFSTVLSRVRALARQVRQLPSGDRPGSGATDDEKQAYRTRQADKDAARDYERYLGRLEASMRGAKSDGEVDQLIGQALQTEDYLRAMLNRN